jgi:dipeptidyl aminopeptidase/acylaminoacyl peptidase
MLPDGSSFIWRSERDGWAHLYHYSMRGELLAQLTSGEFPVIGVTRIDQRGGWVYFQAHGDPDRVYDNHLYRVSLGGGEMQQLTEGKGRHTIAMAPSCEAFLDTFSSVDTPPRTVLRRANGELLQVLAEADISRLEQVGWVPSKEYVVKAADGETDLWVTVHFPYNFDPEKTYPVFEDIYAGPQVMKRVMDFGATRPPSWEMTNFPRALAQLGFLVITMDGRGTPGRSKAFHDTIYRNWGRFEIADHAGAITQLAARLPCIDLDRVAVSGASWGGHYTFRALAQAPEVYRFGIPVVPEYDSRAHTLIEPFLGCLPADDKDVYDVADALALAPLLKGTMLQITGANDVSTQNQFFQMSEALIRLGIHHETMIYPNAGHGWFGATARYDNALKSRWLLAHMQP